MNSFNNEKREPGNPEDEFRRSLQEMLRASKVNFVFGAPPAAAEEKADSSQPPEKDRHAEVLERIRCFDLKPRDVRDYLDRFVVKQTDAKKVLSVAICDHYNHVRRCLEDPPYAQRDYAKHNVILLGPTGVGKTYLLRCIAKLIGVPFVKADATKFSETGYVGRDVEDLVRDLARASDGDVELAQYGIIYIDEIDKIASSDSRGGKDVSGRGVQVNLLKLMEQTEVSLLSQTDLLGQMQAVMDLQRGKSQERTVSTQHILFIVSGAFDLLGDQVKRRLESSAIGFAQDDLRRRSETDYLKRAVTKDFIDYGFEPEFIGRLPVRIVCDDLEAADLKEIMLSSEDNILHQYMDDFSGYQIVLRVTDDAVTEIAEQAAGEKTGARGLMTVLERTLRDFKFELPSTPVKEFEVSSDTVHNPARALDLLLKTHNVDRQDTQTAELRSFAAGFEKEHGFRLSFTDAAVKLLLKMAADSHKSVRSVCQERLRDVHHGLTLVSRNTGRTAFSVSRKLIASPEKELSLLIAESFEQKKDQEARKEQS